jgi:hypothetical protein
VVGLPLSQDQEEAGALPIDHDDAGAASAEAAEAVTAAAASAATARARAASVRRTAGSFDEGVSEQSVTPQGRAVDGVPRTALRLALSV